MCVCCKIGLCVVIMLPDLISWLVCVGRFGFIGGIGALGMEVAGC